MIDRPAHAERLTVRRVRRACAMKSYFDPLEQTHRHISPTITHSLARSLAEHAWLSSYPLRGGREPALPSCISVVSSLDVAQRYQD